MMPKHYLYAYLVVLLLVNIAWAALPVSNEQLEQKTSHQAWALKPAGDQSAPDLQSLMQNGFWGQGDISLGASGQSIKDVEQAEAKKLRAKVKAIIHRNQQIQVLFSDGKKVHRISKGEALKGSDWILIDAGSDWLILQKQDNEGVQERLKLFSALEADKATN
ncbi:MAG: hypothetical protein AAGC78_09140 [Cellvibrio sp.]|uniref:hypothetical protein n=1 Tax=Cellvibrio sp. TaxID=1965322 RepID=UPI0031A99649